MDMQTELRKMAARERCTAGSIREAEILEAAADALDQLCEIANAAPAMKLNPTALAMARRAARALGNGAPVDD